MKGAVIKAVAEFAEVITGGTPSTTKPEYWDGDVPWLNSGSLNEGVITAPSKFITQLGLANSSAKLMPKDTVLVALTGATTGQVGYLAIEASANQSVTGILPSKEHHPKYLYFFLKSQRQKMLGDAFGGAQPHINQKYVKDFKIPLPPLEDQIRIAHLLGKVEGLIAQRKQHLQQLDDLLKSVFLEMFGDPVRNEKGWGTQSLEEIVTDDCPLTYGIVQPGDEFTGGVPIVRPVDLAVDVVSSQGLKRIDPKIDSKFERTRLRGGELLMCVRGTTGVISIAGEELQGANVTRGITPMWFGEQANKRFMFHQLKSHAVQRKIQEKTYGVALKQINLSDVRSLRLIVPLDELQNRFSVIAERMEGTKANYQQSLTDLESLNGALSQQAFKGELDLSRVSLPGTQPEEEEAVAAESLQTPAEQGVTIHLPDTDNLLAALESAESRLALITQWLEAYCRQLGSTPFSVQHFMAAAQTRLAELHPDNDFELGVNDYEHIKTWVFEALATGTLSQAFDDTDNRIELCKRPDNWGSW